MTAKVYTGMRLSEQTRAHLDEVQAYTGIGSRTAVVESAVANFVRYMLPFKLQQKAVLLGLSAELLEVTDAMLFGKIPVTDWHIGFVAMLRTARDISRQDDPETGEAPDEDRLRADYIELTQNIRQVLDEFDSETRSM